MAEAVNFPDDENDAVLEDDKVMEAPDVMDNVEPDCTFTSEDTDRMIMLDPDEIDPVSEEEIDNVPPALALIAVPAVRSIPLAAFHAIEERLSAVKTPADYKSRPAPESIVVELPFEVSRSDVPASACKLDPAVNLVSPPLVDVMVVPASRVVLEPLLEVN